MEERDVITIYPWRFWQGKDILYAASDFEGGRNVSGTPVYFSGAGAVYNADPEGVNC